MGVLSSLQTDILLVSHCLLTSTMESFGPAVEEPLVRSQRDAWVRHWMHLQVKTLAHIPGNIFKVRSLHKSHLYSTCELPDLFAYYSSTYSTEIIKKQQPTAYGIYIPYYSDEYWNILAITSRFTMNMSVSLRWWTRYADLYYLYVSTQMMYLSIPNDGGIMMCAKCPYYQLLRLLVYT